jgi:voltage-gated potassium channel
VQPYAAAGRVMANLMLKPQVTAFVDVVTSAGSEVDLRFEELEVPPDFSGIGRTIGDLRIRGATGAMIIAVRKRDGHFETTPDPDLPLEVGDVMIAAGTDEELGALDNLFRSPEAVAGR